MGSCCSTMQQAPAASAVTSEQQAPAAMAAAAEGQVLQPCALFAALLAGDEREAQRLLKRHAAAAFELAAPGGFTVLHAAAAGGCAAAMPALAAAGVPLDGQLQLPDNKARAALKAFLHSAGATGQAASMPIHHGHTALALAVCALKPRCVEQLLALGAGASGEGRSALRRALQWDMRDGPEAEVAAAVRPILQRGLVDPLLIGDDGIFASPLVRCDRAVASALLAHLEAQRAAGSLQLGLYQAQELIFGAACNGLEHGERWLPLLRHGIAALERQLLGAPAGDGVQPAAAGGSDAQPAAADAAHWLRYILPIVLEHGTAAALEALLASRLPWDLELLDEGGFTLFELASAGSDPAALMRLLLQAGAQPPTAWDLCRALDEGSIEGLVALLPHAAPVLDTSELVYPSLPQDSWSCPIHRVLHQWAGRGHERLTVAMLEALRAAGWRPAVYRDARLPPFLSPSDPHRVLPVLDPFDFYDPARSAALGLPLAGAHHDRRPSERQLFATRDGCWSPESHHHWPPAARAAIRALLLAASVTGGGADKGTAQLGDLPAGVVLRIVRLAAEPLSAWL